MGSNVRLGDLLLTLTDYHANGAYKKLKENVELLDTPNYAVMIRTTNFEKDDFTHSLKYISKHAYDFLAKSKVFSGDLVMNKIANAGSVYYMPELHKPVSLAMNLFLLRVNNQKANPLYVYLYLKQKEAYVKSFANGSVTKTITKDAVRNLEIELPDRDIQEKIVAHYEALSKKIELNKKINQTLEQMAQALFKSWFVDFDPVFDNLLDKHGNNLEKAKAYLESKGAEDLCPKLIKRYEQRQQIKDQKPLPQDIRKLFPSDFHHDQDLGWIPEGWEAFPCSEVIEINPKLKLGKGIVAKYADMKSLPTSGYIADNIIEKEYKGGAKFAQQDVLIARITPCLENGKTAIVDFLDNGEVGFGSTEFIVLRGRGSITMPFVACLARNESFREHCIQSMVGSSGRQRVQNSCFENFYLAIPGSKEELKAFHELVSPIFHQLTSKSDSMRNLNNLRDTLLPKLISGELRLEGHNKAQGD